MFPPKITVDCVGHREKSRFFPTIRMDGDTSNAFISPFQTPISNRYSSSTDNSTSPESYFNTPFQTMPHLEHSTPGFDTTHNRELYESIQAHNDSPIHIFETSISPTQLSYGTYDRNSFNQQYDCSRNTLFESNFSKTINRNLTNFEQKYNDRNPPLQSNFSEGMFDKNVLGFEQNFNKRHTNVSLENNFSVLESVLEQHKNEQIVFGDMPLHFRRARAIVGRRILGDSKKSFNEKIQTETDDYHIRQPQWSNDVEMHYELFPSRTMVNNEFQTPPKSRELLKTSKLSPLASPFMVETAPKTTEYETQTPTSSRSQLSPMNINMFQNMSSHNLNRVIPLNVPSSPNKLPFPDFKPPYNPSLYTGSSSSLDEIRSNKICAFCRKNGETPSVYLSHCVKEKRGNKYIVSCPILRELVCVCGATGDEAHTITYCPELTKTNKGKPLPSTTITLKNTRIKSNGRKRY